MANGNTSTTKSSAEQIADAARAVEIETLKDKARLYSELQLHLTTARKRNATRLSDERYAAAGYVGDPDLNLIDAVNRLRPHSYEDGGTPAQPAKTVQ